MDHAVVVSGIDTSDPNNLRVIVDDPGDGKITSYPMDHFLASWSDGDNTLVATDDPAPATAPGMENFDYTAGHTPNVAGIPYDEFQTMRDQPGFNDAFSHLVQDMAGLNHETGSLTGTGTPLTDGDGTHTPITDGDGTHGLSGDDGVHLNSVDVTPGTEDGHMTVNIDADIDTNHLDPSQIASWSAAGVSIQDMHLTPGDTDGVYHMSLVADVAPADAAPVRMSAFMAD